MQKWERMGQNPFSHTLWTHLGTLTKTHVLTHFLRWVGGKGSEAALTHHNASFLPFLKDNSVFLAVFCRCVGKGRWHFHAVLQHEFTRTSPWRAPPGRVQSSETENAEKKKESIQDSFGKRRVLQNSLWEFPVFYSILKDCFEETVWHH